MHKTIFLILISVIDATISAKILGVFMIEGFSHFNINNAIMETLAMAGHEVTVISIFKPKNPLANITYIQAKEKTPQHVSPWSIVDWKSMSHWKLTELTTTIFEEDCKQFIESRETQDILAEGEKFDLMFVEILGMQDCYLSAARQQNIPIIATICLDLRIKYLTYLGYPYNPSIIPHLWSTRASKMTFVERIVNTINMIYVELLLHYFYKSGVQKIWQKYYPGVDPFDWKLSLIFDNNHRSIFPQLQVPGIIEIGGIHLKPQKPLPKQLEKFIREAERGVILFSFGTVATTKDLTKETRQIFRNVFAKLPQRVVWKFEERIDGISDNVLITEWIPQHDILAQENVVLFISHGGKSSSMEAIQTGTPVLAIPLAFDQFSNAANLKGLGVGIVMDVFTLTETSLLSGIQEILGNTSYKDKARTLSQAFNDRPMSPKETVIYWTEYVLKYNGTDHLQTEAIDMPFYRYHLIDIILFVVITVTLMFVFLFWIIKKAHRLLVSE